MKQIMRRVGRRFALAVPPLNHLYSEVLRLGRENQERAATIAELNDQITDLKSRTLTASEGNESIEAQLYASRSAHHRATALNDKLNRELRELRERGEQLTDQIVELRSQLLTASEGREAIEAQLYVLRSAHHRATALNDKLNHELRERGEGSSLVELLNKLPNRSDLDALFAKIVGKLTLLAVENGHTHASSGGPDGNTARYLNLLELALTGTLNEDASMDPWTSGFDLERRSIGRDWPRTAPTMIGIARLHNLRTLTEQVLTNNVPGDLLEAGAWRGGACILMRGVLAAYGDAGRVVWVADSFEGLPPPDPTYPADTGDQHSSYEELRVSVSEVRANFRRYGLLDDQVRFLEGWFADTLPKAPVERLAILRLDGDMYASTIQTLEALYDRVSPGGFIVVDDYVLPGCRSAVHDFRERNSIQEPMIDVDGAAVFWQKNQLSVTTHHEVIQAGF